MDEMSMLQVLADQKNEIAKYKTAKWCKRTEESMFEWESELAQVVTGVRRSGKSTICHRALVSLGVKYGYVDLNDDRLYGLATGELNDLLKCVYRIYGTDVEYLLLDEIQDVEGWYLFVNRLLRQGMHVVLTGSNAKLLSGELATYMTGRYNKIELYPFSFAEMCAYRGLDTESYTTRAEVEKKLMVDEYLMNGGMPELVKLQSVNARRSYVEGLIETIITKDIAKRFKIRNVESLRKMAHHLINQTCQTVNYSVLSEAAELGSTATAQKYVGYLEQAYLFYRLRKFSYKSRQRINDEKIYVIDTGFITNRGNVLSGENMGWRLENMVLIELKRRYQSMAEDIFYYKPGARAKEVDFVVSSQSRVVELIQVAYSVSENKTFRRETEALFEAAKALKCGNLTLVTFDNSRTIDKDGLTIKIVNAAEWFSGH